MKTGKEKLISKYLSGNTSAQEEKELFDWLKEHPANEALFDQSKSIWKVSLGLKKESEDITEKAWEDFKHLAENEPENISKKFSLRPLQIAAGFALLVALVFLIKYFIPVQDTTEEKVQIPLLKEKENETEMVCITTGDSTAVFYLPDSSRVHLNKNSNFTYPTKFNNTERATLLSGEAFFEVIKTGTPFTVECKETKTTVLGTSFNIKGYENDKKTTVSVVTGTVQLSDKEHEQLTLTANERGTFDSEKTSLSKTKYSDKSFVWWKKIALKARIKKIIKKIKQKIN